MTTPNDGSVAKPARKVVGRPFAKGGDPRQAKGDQLKHGGRTPDEFKAIMRSIASRDEALERLRALTGKKGKADLFLKAWHESADRGFGKATQPIEHAGPDGGPIALADAETLRDAIARQLDGIARRQRTRKDPRKPQP